MNRPNRVSTPFFLGGTAGADGPTGLGTICTSGRAWNVTYDDVLGRPTDAVGVDGILPLLAGNTELRRGVGHEGDPYAHEYFLSFDRMDSNREKATLYIW